MDDIPLKFWMPGDLIGSVNLRIVVSSYFTGVNFRGVLLTRNGVGDVWSVWITDAHGRPSEVRQGAEKAVREHFAATVVDRINGK